MVSSDTLGTQGHQPPGAWAGTEARTQAPRPPLPLSQASSKPQPSALRDLALHPKDKQWRGRAGQGWQPRQCASGLSNHQGPPSNQRAPLQLLERQSRPPLRAPRLPPCQFGKYRAHGPVASSKWHQSHHRKHTTTQGPPRPGKSLTWSPSCWTQTCLPLPKHTLATGTPPRCSNLGAFASAISFA